MASSIDAATPALAAAASLATRGLGMIDLTSRGSPLIERCHVVGGMQYAIDQRGQPLKGVPLFGQILVTIVNRLDAGDHVRKHALGNIGPHARSGH
jgi:hypothetical protein